VDEKQIVNFENFTNVEENLKEEFKPIEATTPFKIKEIN